MSNQNGKDDMNLIFQTQIDLATNCIRCRSEISYPDQLRYFCQLMDVLSDTTFIAAVNQSINQSKCRFLKKILQMSQSCPGLIIDTQLEIQQLVSFILFQLSNICLWYFILNNLPIIFKFSNLNILGKLQYHRSQVCKYLLS